MAYDRYDTRDQPRGEGSRWRDERFEGRARAHLGHEDRGFFERAGDEVASWFGDEDAERRRREDQRMESRGWGRDRDWRSDENRGRFVGNTRDWDRGRFEQSRFPDRGRFERDQDRGFGRSYYRGGYGGERAYHADVETPGAERDYQPLIGGYTASEASEDLPARRRDFRSRGWEGEEARGATYGSRSDPHYHSWRQRQIEELDRDYEDYRRENQARFESDFGSWRERRMHKRGLLGQIREHMEVVGNDEQHVGTIDRVAGDRIILTRSDPESGGAHHSLSCSDIDRVEGDRVILDLDADRAKQQWRDESRSRALFEREDQGEMGDRALNRSFEGTYR